MTTKTMHVLNQFYLAIQGSLHAGAKKKVLYCTQNEILSVLDPTYNYPRMTGKNRCNISGKHCFRSLCISNLYFNSKDKFLFVQCRKIL